MKILELVIIALFQSFSEFFPVSSSGLVQSLSSALGMDSAYAVFISAFLHIPTLVVVIWVFRRSLFKLFTDILFFISALIFEKKTLKDKIRTNIDAFSFLVSCFVMALFFPLGLSGTFKNIEPNLLILINAIGFLICGFFIFFSESGLLKIKTSDDVNIFCSVMLGFVQGVSLVLPGFSRIGSSLAVSTLFGMEKQKAVRCAFVLGVPSTFINVCSCFSVLSSVKEPVSLLTLFFTLFLCLIFSFIAVKALSLLFKSKGFRIYGYLNTAIGVVLTVVGSVL